LQHRSKDSANFAQRSYRPSHSIRGDLWPRCQCKRVFNWIMEYEYEWCLAYDAAMYL